MGTDSIFGKVRPIKDRVLACDLEFGEQKTRKGIILMNDDMKYVGIKPRWCKVYAIGPKVDQIKVGDYILVDHARWTRGFLLDEGDGPMLVRWVDFKDIFLATDQRPGDYRAI